MPCGDSKAYVHTYFFIAEEIQLSHINILSCAYRPPSRACKNFDQTIILGSIYQMETVRYLKY